DYDIGDAVPYRLVAVLPGDVTNYRHYHITFDDRMEPGLTFNGIDSVTVNGAEVTDYILDQTDDQNFKLTLNWGEGEDAAITEDLDNGEVCVYFTATLNDAAVLGSEGNVNACQLTYSNNSTSDTEEDEEKLPWDYVIAFTYGVTINKVDQDGKALEGCEFKLEKKLADGSFELIDRLTVTDGTVFTFTGLDDGDYVLTETVTPKNYRAVDPIEFTVTADHGVWDVTSDDLDFAQPGRTEVLGGLTGDVKTGELKLAVDDALSTLTGEVENPYVPDSVEIPVKKLWTRGGQEIAWPSGARVTVALLADGEQVAEHVLTADASSFTFTGMPKTNYNGTKEITYTVKETSVTGVTDKYNTTIAGNAKEGFVIKNAFGRLPQTSDLIDSMVIRILGAAGSILVGAGSVLAVARDLTRGAEEE
ncbi:MAG: isopeptide-forming domain-containing fimbrial protein, partial [Coriobacteriales bacterium]|nr:isopeptide-forming domain-containing fimbrial protein [Coriobacteriales bacterium]